ncbi:MAG: hypothetical protein ABI892_19885 [Flavobacterium sp.]
MITGNNNENYGREDRNFYHPEDDIRQNSDKKENDIYAANQNNNESYVDEYQKSIDAGYSDDDQILNDDEDFTAQEEEEDLDDEFSNALDRDTFEEDDDLDEDQDWDEDDDLDETDLDDDLVEDYGENDREPESLASDNSRDELDQEYDIDQDLEEKDPVNNPRKF